MSLRAFSSVTALVMGLAASFGITSLATPAHADNYVALPGGRAQKTLLDGTKVVFSLTREHALVSPPMVGVFTSRNVWTSGVYHVSAPGAKKSSITAGYLISCQIRYNSGNYTWNGAQLWVGTDTIDDGVVFSPSDPTTPLGILAQGGVNAGTHQGQLTVSPGNTKFIPVLGSDEAAYDIPGTGGVSYDDAQFQMDDCVGYAAARALAVVQVQTASETAKLSLWGKPFSIS